MEGKRILIVDDDRTTGKVVELQLQKMGYVVVSIAKSASLAIEDVRIHSPDLVLMDINLGTGMDGIEAADIISKDHKTPVVFVTAYADDKTLTRAKLTRPYGYINKPIRESDLRTTITLALERAQAVREAAEPALSAQPGMGKAQIVLNKDGEIIRSNAPTKKFLKHARLEKIEDLLPEGNLKHIARARISRKAQLINGRLKDKVISWEYRATSNIDNVRLTISDITEYRQLTDPAVQGATLSEALNNLATGVIFINENLKVFYVNKSASQLLEREKVLQLNKEYLNCATAHNTAELHKCVLEGVPRTLSLDRGEDQSPLRILATPLLSRNANYG